jgi:hypothetical protein
MKITIVCESMFGNTHEVAQAISDGIRQARLDADVACVPVSDASPELIACSDLLVVGGPTHMRGMTSNFSRKIGISGEQKAEAEGGTKHELEPEAEGPGLRDWFDVLPKVNEGRPAAAFDTRLPSALAGGAAKGIARRLRSHGYHLVSNPEGFILDDAYGPVRPAEMERAKQWGAQLVRASVSGSA